LRVSGENPRGACGCLACGNLRSVARATPASSCRPCHVDAPRLAGHASQSPGSRRPLHGLAVAARTLFSRRYSPFNRQRRHGRTTESLVVPCRPDASRPPPLQPLRARHADRRGSGAPRLRARDRQRPLFRRRRRRPGPAAVRGRLRAQRGARLVCGLRRVDVNTPSPPILPAPSRARV